MARFRFSKLVRDRIPEVLEGMQITPSLRHVGGPELMQALLDKLQEELIELKEATALADQMEELADMLEVIRAYAATQSISWGQIEARRVAKASARGAFKDGIFIDHVTVDNANPEIAKYRARPTDFPELPE